MKKCIICKKEKGLSEFYKHKKMPDGTVNKCKDCAKEKSRQKYFEIKKDPELLEKERKRCRERNIRLGYSKKYYKSSYWSKKYNEKYPEKYKARNKSQRMQRAKGNHLHHWNYSKGFEKDVIELSVKDHNLLHRNMIYDQDLMMYRDLKGNLLNTKESHLKLLILIK
jgi:hypothetical protein